MRPSFDGITPKAKTNKPQKQIKTVAAPSKIASSFNIPKKIESGLELKKIAAAIFLKIKLIFNILIKTAQNLLNNFQNLSKKIFSRATVFLKTILKALFFAVLAIIALIMPFYLIFSLSILRFDADNTITRYLAGIFPVPAIITSAGTGLYSDYSSEYKSFLPAAHDDAKRKAEFEIKKKIVVNGYLRQFKFQNKKISMDELNQLILRDKNINEVPWARIEKIKKLTGNGDFENIYKKYGDSYSPGEYIDSENAVKKFHDSLASLETDQVSDVLIGDDGYYVVKMISKNRNQFGIKYAFIDAITADEYVSGKLSDLIILNLVK